MGALAFLPRARQARWPRVSRDLPNAEAYSAGCGIKEYREGKRGQQSYASSRPCVLTRASGGATGRIGFAEKQRATRHAPCSFIYKRHFAGAPIALGLMRAYASVRERI